MKIICKFLFLFLLFFTLTGCSSFFGSDEITGISHIEPVEVEEGIKLIIHYTDETMEPTEVVIPKGEEGLKGNGIKDIEAVPGDEQTTIVVTYTDTSMAALEFSVPHGAEIEDMIVVDKEGYKIVSDEEGNEYRVDEEGNKVEAEGEYFVGTKYLKVIYTETESPESEVLKSSIFELPSGQDGVDGNGIESIVAGRLSDDGVTIEENKLNDDGSITIQFKYTMQEEPQTITIPSNKGISNILASETSEEYVLTVVYTTKDENGEYEKSEPIRFAKPRYPQWLTGRGQPFDFNGIVGDYYYNTEDNSIWYKKSAEGSLTGTWEHIVTIGQPTTTSYVTFNVNGGKFNFGDDYNGEEPTTITYGITTGNYFYGTGVTFPDVYSPDGAKFLGWYTTEIITPTSTKFTDLTIVNTNITLYAIWQTE